MKIRTLIRKKFFEKNGLPRTFKFSINRFRGQFYFYAPIRIGVRAKKRGVENQICRILLKNSTEGLFIDVGSNFGFISLLAASKGIKVKAFECIPFIYHEFNKSIVKNKFGIKTQNCGIGNIDSESFNYDYYERVFKSPMRKLDSIEFENKIDILKIDIDGEEYQVLKGASSLIEKCKPIIIIELNKDKNKIINWLKRIGYSHFYWTDGTKFNGVYPPNLVASMFNPFFNYQRLEESSNNQF